MNEFFFTEYENAIPREEVRLLTCDAQFEPGSGQLKLALELTPFIDRPSLEIRIGNADQILTSTSLVEVISPKNAFAIHLRTETIPEEIIIDIQVYYLDISLPDESKDEQFEMPKRQIVDNFQQKVRIS